MIKLVGKAGKRAQLIGAAAQRVRRRRSIWRLGAPRRRTRAQMQRRGGTGEREHVQRQPMGRRESGASATGCCHLVDRLRAGQKEQVFGLGRTAGARTGLCKIDCAAKRTTGSRTRATL